MTFTHFLSMAIANMQIQIENIDVQKLITLSIKIQITSQANTAFPRIYLSCTKPAISSTLSTACYIEKQRIYLGLTKQLKSMMAEFMKKFAKKIFQI
jgi:hypothetical protein